MEKVCHSCNNINKSNYKNFCKNCYQKKWITTIPQKLCTKCQKLFIGSGKKCPGCLNAIRSQKSRIICCSLCKRSGLVIINKAESLCTKCDRQKKESVDPTLIIKRRNQTRMSNRRKRGTDLNAPIRKSTGRWKTSQGYILIYKPDHPNCDVNGCIREHTFIMSEYLKRPLNKNENVHHINGIRDDNRIQNLELWHRGQCSGQRLKEKVLWCKQFLLTYGYTILEPGSETWEVMKVEDTP